MDGTKQVFIILRDSGKILVVEEIREIWDTQFLKESKPPSEKLFLNWLGNACRMGLLLRIARGVYQAKPAETNESIQAAS